ncbi:MAG: SET domain-containing protein [Anaerolineales bacterium]|nr:SET domain-containing protein [Anaerolineales bacterium]MBX3005003.1 SET domain-containing protein [Anaerolineales bacterium]MCW5886977.1 SET domain-containing protein [Anaerolineales bacterium]
MTATEDFSLPYPNSWLSPKLEIRQEATIEGRGMFATQPIAKGEIVTIWGGDVVPTAIFKELPEHQKRQSAQVADGFYLVSSKPGPGDFINHSCDANAGLQGQIVIVALREIAAGEEVCIDYAMCDSTPGEDFTCSCGTAQCRGTITSADWQLPELQQRYAGHFSTYLQQKIDASA